MALTITHSPPAIAGTGRPIVLRLTTNNWVLNVGVVHFFTFTFNGGATAGQTWILALNNGTVITFTAAASPDGSGTQFTSGTTNSTTLAADFRKNYWVNYYFILTTPAANQVTFTARQVGNGYQIITPTGTFTNWTNGGSTVGIDRSVRPNFSVVLDIYVEQNYSSGLYGPEPVAKLVQTPGAVNNDVIFDVSAILDAHMADPTLPSYSSALVVLEPNRVKRYKLYYAESYNIPATIQAVTEFTTFVLYALRSRKLQADAAGYTNLSLGNGTFLTGRNWAVKVDQDQKEYISFVWDTTTGLTFTLNMTVFFTDGTNTVVAITFPALTGVGVYTVPAGYNQRSVGTVNPAKTVSFYKITLTWSAGAFDFVYQVAPRCPTFTRWFVFRNELGGWDTLRCGGIMSKVISTEREVSSRVLPANFTMQQAEIFNHDITGQDEYEVSTGYLFNSRTEAEYYARQFFMSEGIYWDVNGRFEPIYLTNNDSRVWRDRNNLWGFGFRFRQGYRHGDKRSNLLNLG